MRNSPHQLVMIWKLEAMAKLFPCDNCTFFKILLCGRSMRYSQQPCQETCPLCFLAKTTGSGKLLKVDTVSLFTAGLQLTILKDDKVCGYALVLYKDCPLTNFWFIPHCEFFLLPSLPRELGTAFCNCFHQSRIHSIWENPVRIKAPAFSPV